MNGIKRDRRYKRFRKRRANYERTLIEITKKMKRTKDKKLLSNLEAKRKMIAQFLNEVPEW